MPLFFSPLSGNTMQMMKDGVTVTDTNVKIIIHSVTSTSSTTKTVDISAYGLTTLYGVLYSTNKSGTTSDTAPYCHITAASTTSISYQLINSKTTGVLIGGSVDGLEYDTSTNVTVTFLIIGS